MVRKFWTRFLPCRGLSAFSYGERTWIPVPPHWLLSAFGLSGVDSRRPVCSASTSCSHSSWNWCPAHPHWSATVSSGPSLWMIAWNGERNMVTSQASSHKAEHSDIRQRTGTCRSSSVFPVAWKVAGYSDGPGISDLLRKFQFIVLVFLPVLVPPWPGSQTGFLCCWICSVCTYRATACSFIFFPSVSYYLSRSGGLSTLPSNYHRIELGELSSDGVRCEQFSSSS